MFKMGLKIKKCHPSLMKGGTLYCMLPFTRELLKLFRKG